MIGRLMVAAGLLGVVALHEQADLPGRAWLVAGSMGVLLGVAAVFALSAGRPRILAGCLLAGWLGYAGTAVWAQARLDQALAPHNVDRVSRVVLRIDSLPRLQPDRVGFEALLLDAHPSGVPRRLRVTWAAPGWRSPYAAPRPADPPFPELRAGQVWRMALVLRPVQAARNPHGFDAEGHAFAAGLRAQGTVRGTPEHLRDENWASLSVVAERARHVVREAMAPHLQGKRYGPVLRALAIGDQDGVEDADWVVFNRTGITHLVSISGSHITMLAGLGALATAFFWRRLHWRGRCLAERWPARRAAACAALAVAWLYCLLAGWGVPARRTFMMLAVIAGAQALQLRLNGPRVLALAAVAVLALDPWAVRASGFWLSFLAVAVLMAVSADTRTARESRLAAGAATPGTRPVPGRLTRWRDGLWLAARLQWAVTWALAAPLAWVFHEVSLVSPLANAYAIPLVELVVTPLSLLLAALALAPGLETVAGAVAGLAHGVLALMMSPTEWLARLPTVPVPAGPAWRYLLAGAAMALALWPRSPTPRLRLAAPGGCGARPVTPGWPAAPGRRLPHRAWAWLGLAPLFCWTPPQPKPGEWDLHALDVGQGSALLLRTAGHALLFDAGARHARDADEGMRTILPALRALGVRRLDALIVSHADLDHAGGVRSVLEGIPVEQTFSSFALEPWLRTESRRLQAPLPVLPRAATACRFGDHWRIDGVSFEFLWPLDEQPVRRGEASNAGSCVLRVRGAHHSLLLTGDIEARTEAALIKRGLAPADVVVAAHHGSRTSSSAPFVQAVAAGHVILQAGRWNRHGHPDPGVLTRWGEAGTRIWRTDHQGGVNAQSRERGLSLYSVFESSRRYWHGRRP